MRTTSPLRINPTLSGLSCVENKGNRLRPADPAQRRLRPVPDHASGGTKTQGTLGQHPSNRAGWPHHNGRVFDIAVDIAVHDAGDVVSEPLPWVGLGLGLGLGL